MKISRRVRAMLAMVLAVSFTIALLPTITLAAEKSPWLVRARLLGVVPDDSSSDITVIGGKAEVDDTMTPELDISYFITDNLAVELILGVTNNNVNAVNTAVGNIDLGDVWLLPPTVTLQYHFLPNGQFRPYVGAGINYTVFFSEDPGAADGIEYEDGFGFALQAGIDIGINDNWAINVDVKKIWLSTDVAVRALGTTVRTSVDIDPWLIGVGVAYRF